MLSHALLQRRTFHRAVFILAGIYNLLWGLLTVLDPLWIFRLTPSSCRERR